MYSRVYTGAPSPPALGRGLSGGVGGARNLTHRMVWCNDALLALVGPSWSGGSSTKPDTLYGITIPCSLWWDLPGG
eukprot:6640650-Pyramimonas_sp.AAC.1